MARIKKRGLDYFPLDTDFMHHRVVRRIMKREGDRALGILVALFSYIYADEGYYLELDGNCLEDLAANFYDCTADDVRRVVEAAVEGGLFDDGLYASRSSRSRPRTSSSGPTCACCLRPTMRPTTTLPPRPICPRNHPKAKESTAQQTKPKKISPPRPPETPGPPQERLPGRMTNAPRTPDTHGRRPTSTPLHRPPTG